MPVLLMLLMMMVPALPRTIMAIGPSLTAGEPQFSSYRPVLALEHKHAALI